jgi:hypothetical protein
MDEEEDSLIASYSRNRSKWQNDSSKFTPKGILPREAKQLPTSSDNSTSKTASKPVEIEDNSIILNYHINRTRWQNDSSKFTPKGILPRESSPMIIRKSNSNSDTIQASSRTSAYLDDERSVFSLNSIRDRRSTSGLHRVTSSDRRADTTELVESLDIEPQYSFYAEYFGQDESLKSFQNVEVADNSGRNVNNDSFSGHLRQSSIGSGNASEEGEWNKPTLPKQQKTAKDFSNESSSSNNNIEYHRIFAERTVERNRPNSLSSRGRSKTPPTKGIRMMDENDVSKENILTYSDESLLAKNSKIASIEPLTQQNNIFTLPQQFESQQQSIQSTIVLDSTQEITNEACTSTPRSTVLKLESNRATPQEATQRAVNSSEVETVSENSARPSEHLHSNALEKVSCMFDEPAEDCPFPPESSSNPYVEKHMEDEAGGATEEKVSAWKSPKSQSEGRMEKNLSGIQDINLPKKQAIRESTKKKSIVNQELLESYREITIFGVAKETNFHPLLTNNDYLLFSGTSDDEPIIIEASDFHGIDEVSDNCEFSMQNKDEIFSTTSSANEKSNFEKSEKDVAAQDLEAAMEKVKFDSGMSDSHASNSMSEVEKSPIKNTTELDVIASLDLIQTEKINDDSSAPMMNDFIEKFDLDSNALFSHDSNGMPDDFDPVMNSKNEHFVTESFDLKASSFAKSNEDASAVDLNDTIEKFDFYGITLMNSMNEGCLANSRDGEQDIFFMQINSGQVDKLNGETDANHTAKAVSGNYRCDVNRSSTDHVDPGRQYEGNEQSIICDTDNIIKSDIFFCDATTVSSFTEEDRPSSSNAPHVFFSEAHLMKEQPQSVDEIKIGSSPPNKTKHHLQSSKDEDNPFHHSESIDPLSNMHIFKTKDLLLLEEKKGRPSGSESHYLLTPSDEKNLFHFKSNSLYSDLNNNNKTSPDIFVTSSEVMSSQKKEHQASKERVRGKQKTERLHRLNTGRVKGETDFLLAASLAVSASKIIPMEEIKAQKTMKKFEPKASNVPEVKYDFIDAPMDELNDHTEPVRVTAEASIGFAEEEVTMSKCANEMKHFWEWAARFAKEANPMSHISPSRSTSNSGGTVVVGNALNPFGGSPELDHSIPIAFQNIVKVVESTKQTAHADDQSQNTGQHVSILSALRKQNPSQLVDSVQPLSSKVEAVKSNFIVLSGNILARTSFKNIFMKKWKKSFWIQFEAKLMLFRSMEDFKEWKSCHFPNPLEIARGKNGKLPDNLVKFRIDFLGEMSRPGVRGFRATEVKSKIYEKGGPLM